MPNLAAIGEHRGELVIVKHTYGGDSLLGHGGVGKEKEFAWWRAEDGTGQDFVFRFGSFQQARDKWREYKIWKEENKVHWTRTVLE